MKTILLFLISCVVFLDLSAQNFVLPKLNFSYKDLEPHIDAQTMEIHYSKHHQAYVTNLNKALVGSKFENQTIEEHLLAISRRSDAVRNNAGGHYNHSLFWEILTPVKNTQCSEKLLSAIAKKYQSLDSLKKLISLAGASRFGSGWAWLIVTPQGELSVCSTANQDNPLMDISSDRGVPILGIDVWEHAYYLKYQNKRGDYLKEIWNVIDWTKVSEKYEMALSSPLLKYLEIDTWKALKSFKTVFDENYSKFSNSIESSDMIAINSSQLVLEAINLKSSIIPKSVKNDETKLIIEAIVTKTNELNKLVKKKMNNAVVKSKMFEINEQLLKLSHTLK